jgi:hypothetical protein
MKAPFYSEESTSPVLDRWLKCRLLQRRELEGKGAVKLGWVPTAELNKQSGLNCTGRGPSFAGRATAGSMVRKRNMRWKPLYLDTNSRASDGIERQCCPNRRGLMFRAGERAR